MTRFLKILAVFPLLCGTVFAQTNVIDGGIYVPVTNDWDNGGLEILVGSTSAVNRLDIYAGATVTNVSSLTVGRDAGADENALIVDQQSGLLIDGDITVGENGAANAMQISGGSLVENEDAYVGSGSDSNVVVVSGGSIWNNEGTLYLNNGVSNWVSVGGNGATVWADKLELSAGNDFYLNEGGVLALRDDFDASTDGFNWNESSLLYLTNGTFSGLNETNGAAYLNGGRNLTLNDSDMDLTTNDLVVGLNGSESTLRIENGGTVNNVNGAIGQGNGSESNVVIVSGIDSEWRNTGGTLDIGVGAGTGNALEVSDGGWIYVGDVAQSNIVGATTNGGLAVANSGGADLTLNNGAQADISGGLFIGTTNGLTGTVTVQSNSVLNAGTLAIEDGSTFTLKKTGSLNVEGDFAYGDDATKFVWENNTTLGVGGTLSKTNGLDGEQRTVQLNGGDWDLADSSVISGTSNTVDVLDGALLETSAGVISGTNNTVTVSGAGSLWDNAGQLSAAGTNNEIAVSSGGKISAGSIGIADGNTFNLNAGGTLSITSSFDWATTDNLNWATDGNLEIGGTLTGMETTNTVINGTTNVATILDGGRNLTLNNGIWDNTGNDLIIGYNSSGASAVFSNGAQVVNEDGYIGWGDTSGGNSVRVKDVGTVWKNEGGDLYVGSYYTDGSNPTATGGNANFLYVETDAQVLVGDGATNAPGMLVADSGGASFTVWNGRAFIDDTLMVGLSSNVTGVVNIKNGGYLSVGDLAISDDSSFTLESGGIFDIRTNFNLTAPENIGFTWESNSTLSVGGNFTKGNAQLDQGQDLFLDGSNAVWDISGQLLEVGLDGQSVLEVLNGGTLLSAGAIIGVSTNTGSHRISLANGATWTSTGDLQVGTNTQGNVFEILSGSTNTMTGSAYIGGINSSSNTVTVSGSNSYWRVDQKLLVGAASSNSLANTLAIGNQALVEVGGNVDVYGGNTISFSGGTNMVGGDFTLHSNAVLSGIGTIQLTDAAGVLNLMNGNDYIFNPNTFIAFEGTGANTVNVGGGEFALFGSNSNSFRNFQTLEMNDAELYGFGTNDAFEIVRMTNSTINPIGFDSNKETLVLNGTFASSNTTYLAQIGLDGQDLLKFSGGTAVDLTGLNLNLWVADAVTNEYTILEADLLAGNFASNSVQTGLLLYDAEAILTNNTVRVVITENSDKFSSSLDYAGTESVRAGFNGMKNAVFTRTKQLRRNLVSTAHAMPHDAFLMTNTNAPVGPQGPGADNTIFDMHVWAQFFGGQGNYDAHGNSYGFDLNNSGTTFGADRLVGEDLTLGFNYTYVRGDARTTNADYLDSETYWLGGYGEWVGQSGWYVDALLAYGRSNFDSQRVENSDERNYVGTASYRGNAVGGYLDVGQYMYYKSLSLAPYAGLHMLFMGTDDHTEQNQNGNSEISVKGVDRNLVESALGMKMRHRFDTGVGRFQTTGFAEWTHDFVQDEIATTLQAKQVGGLSATPLTMYAIKPESDLFNVGLGFSWRNREYMEIGIGYNGRFSADYEEHSGSLMLDIMF